MGIAGRLARDRAQPEALGRVERRAPEAAIVEGERFGLAIFEKQLAVVGAVERIIDNGLYPGSIHPGAGEEQLVGMGKIGHRRGPRMKCIGEYGSARRRSHPRAATHHQKPPYLTTHPDVHRCRECPKTRSPLLEKADAANGLKFRRL